MHSVLLDPRTVGVVSDFVALCLTALALLLWRSGQMYPGFGRWTIARLIGVLNILFSIQIGVWPHSIIVAGICAMLGSILSLEACRQFLGLKPVLRWTYGGFGAIVLQLVLIEALARSPQTSYVEVTFALGLIHVLTGVTLLSKLPVGMNRGRLVAGIAFLSRGAVYMMRTAYFAVYPSGTLFDASSINLAFLVSNVIYDIIVNVSFFLMHYERALADRAAEVCHTTAANKALTELKITLEERVRERTAELVRSQKLESVARLAGGVAHDFNNVLMVINGYSALLLGQLRPEDPMYEPLAQIEKAGERAAGITRQLLAFSRQQKDDPQKISCRSLVMGMMDMLRRLIGEDIEIVFKPADGADEILADKGQIEQVVMNLAINSRDAMPGGGKLFIETAHATVSDDFGAHGLPVPPGKYLVLSVTDTGVGMAPDVQALIFEPFFTTKGHGGTGLGLSTTYGIVKQCGGGITVQSTLGFGTTFRVYLPAVEPAGEESTAVATSAPVRGTETILLVEDQADVRTFIREILDEHGYNVLDAARGEDAIAIAKRYLAPIHLLITDMVLPQMNGPEIVKRIRHIQPDIGVLLMSGYTAERLDGQLDGQTPYLQKPFTPDKLLTKIREILDTAPSTVRAV
jgi:signal transduction histidine kinase/CheY-like chemotaxis protein